MFHALHFTSYICRRFHLIYFLFKKFFLHVEQIHILHGESVVLMWLINVLVVDGCSCVVVNGNMVAQGSQFSLKDVEVVVAQVDLDAVRYNSSYLTLYVQFLSLSLFCVCLWGVGWCQSISSRDIFSFPDDSTLLYLLLSLLKQLNTWSLEAFIFFFFLPH